MEITNPLECPPSHQTVVDINRETWGFFKRWETTAATERGRDPEFWEEVNADMREIKNRYDYSLCRTILSEYITILEGYHNAAQKGEIPNGT